MTFRYTLRLSDGTDIGEVSLQQPASVGDTVQVNETRCMRVRAVVAYRTHRGGRQPRVGFLVVEPIH